jgi:hypothetical protein
VQIRNLEIGNKEKSSGVMNHNFLNNHDKATTTAEAYTNFAFVKIFNLEYFISL